ncbi:MAG: GIY-YIG nuclease family protein [Candidatus Liptonbacteria bacterium]|nr:GIY-YIG nuclease family protein [Candidatus Liptonbacteria bacterium]
MWYVYVLQSLKDDKFYVGSTSNLTERLWRHNAGRNLSTKHRRPFELIYSETYDNKKDAVRREFQIKRYRGGEALKKLIGN